MRCCWPPRRAPAPGPLSPPSPRPAPPLQPLTFDEAFSGALLAAPRLSPDGRYLALLVTRKGRQGLSVYDLQAGRYESHLGYSDTDMAEPRWLGSGHLLFTLAQHGQSRQTETVQGGLFVTTRDGRHQSKLHDSLNAHVNRGLRRYTWMEPLQPVPGSDAEFIALCNDVDKDSVDVYRVNALTGKRQRLTAQRPARTEHWVLDAQLQPRVAISSVEKTTERIVHHREADGRWRELWRFRVGRDDVRVPLSVEADGRLLVATNEGRDTVALREYDAATGQWGDVLIEHPRYDVAVDALGEPAGALLRHEVSGELLGVQMHITRPVFAWLDERRQQLQALVDRALPGRINVLQFSSAPRVFVSSRTDTEGARWYLLDTQSGRLDELPGVAHDLDARRVPATETLALHSRDGLPLSALVLRPPRAAPDEPLPTLVLVHGGGRTPLEQAEFMRDALRRAGNPPLWLSKFGEGHSYRLRSNQQELLELLEPFLAGQLAPAGPR